MPLDEDTLARAMAGEDVQLSYAADWIRAQAENTTAEPSAVSTQAAAGWAVLLAALAVVAVWLGRW